MALSSPAFQDKLGDLIPGDGGKHCQCEVTPGPAAAYRTLSLKVLQLPFSRVSYQSTADMWGGAAHSTFQSGTSFYRRLNPLLMPEHLAESTGSRPDTSCHHPEKISPSLSLSFLSFLCFWRSLSLCHSRMCVFSRSLPLSFSLSLSLSLSLARSLSLTLGCVCRLRCDTSLHDNRNGIVCRNTGDLHLCDVAG